MGLRPRRDPAIDKSIVLALANFKGGVAKTTSSVHLAQYLCLRGYRVLLIDLDAQASLTQLFGILPHTEVPETRDGTALLRGRTARVRKLDRHVAQRDPQDPLA